MVVVQESTVRPLKSDRTEDWYGRSTEESLALGSRTGGFRLKKLLIYKMQFCQDVNGRVSERHCSYIRI